MNTENMLMLYLAECEERRRLDRKTVKAYRCDLRQFCHFLNGRAASRTLLEDYLCRLHARYAPRSVRRKLASLHAFFSYLVFHERIEENPLPFSFRGDVVPNDRKAPLGTMGKPQSFHIGQHQGSYALGVVADHRFPHIIVKGSLPHLLISKAGYQADAA